MKLNNTVLLLEPYDGEFDFATKSITETQKQFVAKSGRQNTSTSCRIHGTYGIRGIAVLEDCEPRDVESVDESLNGKIC
ncbi:unnamed protein product [Rotaria magnacalcarata]|uniref:Uncharacterized protein n=1 Tax=Rotaria magnacalcarata TaxID=392030 RepID=A0A819RRR6_9BILA|nr:unnamed protein product [Rotaria magnacalcarata]CAF4048192.1 unnamed protein product [Rotaria magnacalcarata]CAF4063787.1 unnamed protein product [Rotaria magnacalcarata]